MATARGFDPELAEDTLAGELSMGMVDADELCGAMDWLQSRQRWIEDNLPKGHPGGPRPARA